MTSEKPSQLVEFRNYRIRAGATDPFIEHFERHLLESQEALGMEIIGQFRLLDDPDRFAWIRRFRSPLSRAEALENFYGGPVWKEFGPRANELMVEYTDVHLLVPDRSAPAFGPTTCPTAVETENRPDHARSSLQLFTRSNKRGVSHLIWSMRSRQPPFKAPCPS
jgi:hypothetical protein